MRNAGWAGLVMFVLCGAAPAAPEPDQPGPAAADAAVVAAIRGQLATISPWTMEEIEVATSPRGRDRELPPPDAKLRVLLGSLPASTRNAIVSVEAVPAGVGGARIFQVAVDIHVRTTILRASRRLAYGKVVESDDLEEVRTEVRDLRREYLRSGTEIVGKVLRRGLAAGDPLTRDCVVAPQLVRFGEVVRVRAGSGGVAISALARAEQGGRLGDLISVRSVDFKRSLRARVVARGQVMVE